MICSRSSLSTSLITTTVPRNAPFSVSSAIYQAGRESQLSASSKLFADAAKEERQSCNKSHPTEALKSNNWTGEESMHDAILRMLVDKYKPLRSGSQTAEEKIRASPPMVSSHDRYEALDSLSSNPVVKDHKPWLVTFKAPAHATTPLVRTGHINAPQSPVPLLRKDPTNDDQLTKRRIERVDRLHRAKESTLDYRIGKPAKGAERPNPITLKGWASLVEERIENARNRGQFDKLTGRGTPFTSRPEETNPFIARDEYLLNRMVMRNGAAPPWVGIQGELEISIGNFRQILHSSWVRRAVRNLTNEHSVDSLRKFTRNDLTTLRDQLWETREMAYHEEAVKGINSLVRKYNTLAPYAVRRAYLTRTAELERCYNSSGEAIMHELEARARIEEEGRHKPDAPPHVENGGALLEIWEGFKRWLWHIFA